MQVFSTTKATETKKLQSRRNLFGLGVTSLIAACSGAADEGAGGGGETEEERIAREAREQEERADALPFKAGALTNSGYTAEIETSAMDDFDSGTAGLDVKITKDGASTFLNFPTGGKHTKNTANIHKLTPNLGQYDLVISAPEIDKNDSNNGISKGRIFIYWDVAKVAAASDPKASTHLEVKGAIRGDNIGVNAPDFLKIGGTDNKYDMVIRSERVDNPDGNGFGNNNDGAIFILWDIVDYAEATKTIDLNPAELGNATTGAISGSLAIYGGSSNLPIGSDAPEFLEIGGGTGDKLDMVIGQFGASGLVCVLWDVEDYYQDAEGEIANKMINLITLDDANPAGHGATAGSLRIIGAKVDDNIGAHAPEFLQIGGKDDNYDMVIRSHFVDKTGDDGRSDEGAIYILWDVKDYYQDENNLILNKNIDLGAVDNASGFYATSGLLTIYGAARQARLGSDDKNILYKTADGNKTLTNIDKDMTNGGTIDIAFRDKEYTYVLFGDKIAEVANGKVASKTIDLSQVNDNGFFAVTFNGTGLGTSATTSGDTKQDGSVGYRFASGTGSEGANGGYTFADVQNNFPRPSGTTLSDADGDLGVWDIA